MSNATAGKRNPEFSRWVAPEVGAASEDRSPVSEELIEEIKRKAKQAGYEEGLRSGLQEAQQRTDERLAVLTALIGHVSEPLAQVEVQTMEALVDLALGVGRMLVDRELAADPSLVLAAVQAGLAALPELADTAKITVNPSDFDVVREAYASNPVQRAPALIADASVTQGGAVIEVDSTVVDMQFEARLQQIRESIFAQSNAQ